MSRTSRRRSWVLGCSIVYLGYAYIHPGRLWLGRDLLEKVVRLLEGDFRVGLLARAKRKLSIAYFLTGRSLRAYEESREARRIATNMALLSYILSRIRVLSGENRREHYSLLRKIQRSDFSSAGEFEYARARQDLQVCDLRRYGIIGLLVDDYSHYTEILRRISQKYRRGWVFISGSAVDYRPWTSDKAEQLIEEISSQLVREGFGVVSGFGVGVGTHVVNGVLEPLEKESTRLLDDRIILRPFPLGISDPTEQASMDRLREDMLDHAGISLFLFGNKLDPFGNLTEADGVEEEFRIASSREIAVVPLGCTGSVAAKLHQSVLDEFATYYLGRGYRSLFKDLARMGSPSQVTSRVLKFVKKLRDEA